MKKLLLVLAISLLMGASCNLRTNSNEEKNNLRTNSNEEKIYSCIKHGQCPLQTLEDCGGELCLPRTIPFCDKMECRTPKNNDEWISACKDRDSDFEKLNCFSYLTEKVNEKSGFVEAFKICDNNFSSSENVEKCKLNICGYDPSYPQISPGDPDCVSKAISSSCHDGIENGRETDVDCGGPECNPCKEGDSCADHEDCESGICEVHGNRTCHSICPDGPISNNEPCGCFQKISPQGDIRELPIPIDNYVGNTEGWENEYGNGKKVYCCNGESKYLLPGSDCKTEGNTE